MYAAGHKFGYPVVQHLLKKYAADLDLEVVSPSTLYLFEWNEEYLYTGSENACEFHLLLFFFVDPFTFSLLTSHLHRSRPARCWRL